MIIQKKTYKFYSNLRRFFIFRFVYFNRISCKINSIFRLITNQKQYVKRNFYFKCIYIRIHCNSIDSRNIYLEQMDEFTHRTFKKKKNFIKREKKKLCLTDIQSLVWGTQNTSMRDGIQFSTENTYTLSTNCCMSKTLTSLCKRIYLTYAGVSQSKKKNTMKLNIVRGHGLILYFVKITLGQRLEYIRCVSVVYVDRYSYLQKSILVDCTPCRYSNHTLHVNEFKFLDSSS